MPKEVNLANLVIDDRIKVPQALNRHMASVSLQALSNNFSNGYDLSLSAYVKPEKIDLKLGDGCIQATMAIYNFEVDLIFSNSIPALGLDHYDLGKDAEVRFDHSRASRSSRKKSAGFNIDLSIQPNAALAGGLLGRESEENELQSNRQEQRLYQHPELGCVAAYSPFPGEPLQGAIISNYKGWRVTPKSVDTVSGALARLRVQQHWISLGSLEPQGTGNVFGSLRRLFTSQEGSNEFKRQAFSSLLETLVFLRLQDPAEKNFATLAASCVALRPDSGIETLVNTQRAKSIEIELQTIENFLQLDEQSQINQFVQEKRNLASDISDQQVYTDIAAESKFTKRQVDNFSENDTLILDKLSLPLLIVDPSGGIETANKAARAVLGVSAGLKYSQAFNQPAVIEAIEAALQGTLPTGLIRFSTPDTEFMCHISRLNEAKTIPKENKFEQGSLILEFRDVEREQIRSDFVANVSHELRTPIASLLGCVETMQGPARGDEAGTDRFLKLMHRQATQMGKLVDEILSLSRAEAMANERPKELVQVVELVRRAIDQQRQIWPSIEFKIQFGSASEAELIVPGDADQLMQVFNDLLDNAAKHGNAGQRVLVELDEIRNDKTLGNAVRIKVTDFGPGIDIIHLPRLTERFYRVIDESSREHAGTGLGLALVKHIVNRHRGILKVDSIPGEGSTFAVLLPKEIHAASDLSEAVLND